MFFNAVSESGFEKDNKYQTEIITKLLDQQETVTVYNLITKIDDEIKLMNMKPHEEVSEMNTDFTPENVENVKKVVKSGFNIHAIVALFTMFVSVVSLLLLSQQHKAHTLFGTTNEVPLCDRKTRR